VPRTFAFGYVFDARLSIQQTRRLHDNVFPNMDKLMLIYHKHNNNNWGTFAVQIDDEMVPQRNETVHAGNLQVGCCQRS
jgi:hypothetical protein